MYAIVDVETTGLSPVFDRIIEIAVVVYDGQQTLETYSTLVNPEVRLAPNVTRLTGITNELLQDAPKFYEIARKIVELTEFSSPTTPVSIIPSCGSHFTVWDIIFTGGSSAPCG